MRATCTAADLTPQKSCHSRPSALPRCRLTNPRDFPRAATTQRFFLQQPTVSSCNSQPFLPATQPFHAEGVKNPLLLFVFAVLSKASCCRNPSCNNVHRSNPPSISRSPPSSARPLIAMTAHTTKQLALATTTRDQQDPMPSSTERATRRSAMWSQHVQDVGACMCHWALPPTGPSLAPRHLRPLSHQ